MVNDVAIALARIRTHLENAKQRQRLQAMAHMDGLTGIANRRFFDERLMAEWSRAQRQKSPLSLVMLDVDYFKQYNDHYGHMSGDEVLQQVAGTISGSLLRQTDVAARYGGEEFVILLPDTDEDGGATLAERVRSEIESLKIPHSASLVADCDVLTVSIGGTTVTPDLTQRSESLLSGADIMLYASKAAGRNRVRWIKY